MNENSVLLEMNQLKQSEFIRVLPKKTGQENIEMESQRTNSTFAIRKSRHANQKLQRAIFFNTYNYEHLRIN
jgi:hypothetical protein